MNHPKPEEWVPYLYGELKSNARLQLRAHLKDCAECRSEVARWQRSADRLSSWKLPRAQTPLTLFAPALKWAAAAVIVLGLGFALGRASGNAAVTEQLRAKLRQDIVRIVQQEVAQNAPALLQVSGDQTEKLLSAYNAVIETRRAEDLQKLEDLRRACLVIKGQLDTVAINAQNQFVQLASYQPPASKPAPQ